MYPEKKNIEALSQYILFNNETSPGQYNERHMWGRKCSFLRRTWFHILMLFLYRLLILSMSGQMFYWSRNFVLYDVIRYNNRIMQKIHNTLLKYSIFIGIRLECCCVWIEINALCFYFKSCFMFPANRRRRPRRR